MITFCVFLFLIKSSFLFFTEGFMVHDMGPEVEGRLRVWDLCPALDLEDWALCKDEHLAIVRPSKTEAGLRGF